MESVAAEKVEGNDDVLLSILVRLPPKSVFRFMCVSNRWKNIISEPYFLKSYSAITRKHLPRGERLLAFMQLTRSRDLESQMLLPSELGKFITSSNGLILCHSKSLDTYHVGNPLTKKWVLLPPPGITFPTYHRISTGLSCEANTNELVPNFTVVRVGYTKAGKWNTMYIETYSSRTGTWAAISKLISTWDFYLHLDPPPLVCNGVVHWSGWRSIALYDLNGGDNHLQLIELPIPHDGEYYDSSFTRSESDDVLWFGNIDTFKYQNMQFWMLPKNKDGSSYRRSTTIPANEWTFMHTITSASLHKELAIESNFIISLEGLIPCNPIVVVLRHGESVFLYNLETKSIESSLQYNGDRSTKWWYPYMESLYLSSYALRGNQQLPRLLEKKPCSKKKNILSWLVPLFKKKSI